MRAPAAARLPLVLAAAYAALVVFGSLHPFSGWHDTGVAPTAFLFAGWPRYYTAFDLATNVAAYLPLGFLWLTALRGRWPLALTVAAVALLGAGLSGTMEALQNYLPTRVPSNVDLGCNTLGTLAGALAGTRWGHGLLDGGHVDALRRRLFLPGAMGDTGLLLIGLWLLTQFNPETLLFGNGDLRSLLGLPAALDYSAGRYAEIETAVVAAHTAALALIATRLGRQSQRLPVLALLGLALLAKSLALALSLGAVRGFAWASPGGIIGAGIGIGIWLVATLGSARAQKAVAAVALLAATVLVNLAPENPYRANTWHTWNPGQFLNFLGLTKLVSSLWPFLALPWLMMLRTDRKEKP